MQSTDQNFNILLDICQKKSAPLINFFNIDNIIFFSLKLAKPMSFWKKWFDIQ